MWAAPGTYDYVGIVVLLEVCRGGRCVEVRGGGLRDEEGKEG